MKALLTIEEASELTKLSVKTLYTYAEKEKIPHVKLGRRVLFNEDKIEGWVKSCEIAPAGESMKKAAVENGTATDKVEEPVGEPA